MTTTYAHIVDGEVVNVVDAPADLTPGWLLGALGGQGEIAPLSDFDPDPVGIGWKVIDGVPVPPPRRNLAVDRTSIPGDGTTAATVTYTDTHNDAPASVVFTVNGLDSNAVDLVGAAATLQVTSTTPGDVIEVTVNGLSLSIQVQES